MRGPLVPFSLEAIDDHRVDAYWNAPRSSRHEDPPPKPWVGKLTGICSRYGYCRLFLDGRKDYSQANRRGSRGVMVHWLLEPGHVYQVQELRLRRSPVRYFIRVEAHVERVEDEDEVRRCLLANAVLELMSLLPREDGSRGPLIDLPPSMLASRVERILRSSSIS